MIHKGYFVIADITGYTAFMTGSELDHAQDILKSLFDTILDNIKPPLTVSNYQGDAILTYAPEEGIQQGQTLLELIENVYFAFSRKRDHIRHATTCTCRACSNIANLDLKLFTHYGEFVMQDMRGKQELGGPDVIIAHRMMKNTVKEQTGVKAYTLFSDAAIQQLGLAGMCVQMQAHTETYEHIGDVMMWVYDLKAAYERDRERNPVLVQREDAWYISESDFALPPAMVWDYLNKPECRRRWMSAEGFFITNLNKGRVGVGAVNHCAHGKGEETLLTILDWRPFDYVTVDSAFGFNMHGLMTTYLQPIPGGTHVTWVFAKPEGLNALGKIAARVMSSQIRQVVGKTFGEASTIIQQMIDEDGAGRLISFSHVPA